SDFETFNPVGVFEGTKRDWAGLDEDEDAHVWEDNWDDDNVEDDFSNQLSPCNEHP
ncbi:hypothetical protein FD754_019233, partial [Muntiacus muntjak]